MVALARPILPENYTKSRSIRVITAAARASLTLTDLAFIQRSWLAYRGKGEDEVHNVIMETVAPESRVRTWVMDRDGPDGLVILMLPSDY
jgi:hypothetical protein